MGEPQSYRDIAELFVKYLKNEIETLPWSESPLTGEADAIRENLVNLNRRGILTVNSQPAVDGVKSSHPIHGWGPSNGYVYQKSYLEVLVHPRLYQELTSRMAKQEDLTYYAVTKSGQLETNAPSDGPNAVTWGVFPGKEIVQPTIVESVSFLAWRDEAFQLGMDWAKCFDSGSASRKLIEHIMTDWHLINIVNNDFHDNESIFKLFDGLEIDFKELESPFEGQTDNQESVTNGSHASQAIPKEAAALVAN
uniref:MTHFR SAM-binding regulatory domain-containing protein n=1 Tax=Bionectria ochroleuca TaxID=29856 RepID=A0A8H7TR23_BIOOC